MTTDPQLAQLGLFEARVPRYTSYPTALHFSAAVGRGEFSDWISAIPEGAEISLYVHIPFCRRLCWFCACRTQGTTTAGPVAAYVDVLKAELRLLKAYLPRGVRLSRLHWGGGTPTLMDPAMIKDLAEAIFEVVPLGAGGEFSVEIDPNEIDAPRLDALAAMGMSRVSIGIQDFNPAIQKIIGREQSYDATRDVVEAVRARGIPSLNADILFGLPQQTKVRMSESVQKLLSLSPDRVALYGYAHVPWMARRQMLIPTEDLPRPEERFELFEIARDLFTWDGYEDIGIDHFARPEDGLAQAARHGKLRRNFQGYTDDTSAVLVGLGASAISRFPQGYAQNAPATSAYNKAISEGRFATSRGHTLSHEDKFRARMIETLMCDFKISSNEMIHSYAVDKTVLNGMYRGVATAFPGMVHVTEDGLTILPKGRPLTRMIARQFDAYDLSDAGHSPAM